MSPAPGIKIAAAGAAEPSAEEADPWNVGLEGCEQLNKKFVFVSVGLDPGDSLAGLSLGGLIGHTTV